MKIIRLYILFLVVVGLQVSCSKTDTIEDEIIVEVIPTSVSGTVLDDTDDDGIGDTPIGGARVYIGNSADILSIMPARPDTLDAPYNEIYWTDTDDFGNYTISGLIPFENKSIHVYQSAAFDFIEGYDRTPDGDMLETEPFASINVSVEQDERDSGNDFVFQLLASSQISGVVQIDLDKDGILDGGQEGIKLWLSQSNDQGSPVGLAIDTALTNSQGFYDFTDIPQGDYVVSFGSNKEFTVISGGDDSPDGDLTNLIKEFIPVTLLEGEADEDNNFAIVPKWHNVSGLVLEDVNGDGIGDDPVIDQRIELYKRTDNGVPQMPLIAFSYSDVNGNFKFIDLDPADYVIYYIGSADYTCATGMDLSPEPGEPQNNSQCFFIQTDVPTSSSEDGDNTFVVTKN